MAADSCAEAAIIKEKWWQRGDGEVSRDKQKSRPCMKDGGQDDGGRNEEEDGSAELESKKNWEEFPFLLLSREVIMMLQLIRASQFLMQV